ncbi:type II secretion system F family protein [Agromyces intestinalis]|uniref:Type II secretion system F family protein n=1 Tax=Agromyces intestinalis TaxID=2592652 RepID=A0A5C1YI40_9MICO|nr:type II secretion system F family protein [Agromyces intestinalis]QEO15633.1 type II secretion system F family protein [Agromyces intestinalis]
MSIVLGASLGLGLLLMVSPLLWPARGATTPSRVTAGGRIRDELRLAGLGGVPFAVVVTMLLLIAVASAAIAQAVFSLPMLTAVAGALGLLLVPLLVHRRASRRRAANRAVWPEVVDHLVASVRAGVSLPDSVAALADLGPSATRADFQAFAADYARTGSFSVALDRLKDALADPVADRLVETLRMAREVGGGELTSVLRNLARYLREDAALRGELRARQSWIRNAARLGVAAPWVLLVVLATKPETIAAYDSAAGSVLLLVGVAVSIVAYRAMIALGRLPEERRWFR